MITKSTKKTRLSEVSSIENFVHNLQFILKQNFKQQQNLLRNILLSDCQGNVNLQKIYSVVMQLFSSIKIIFHIF